MPPLTNNSTQAQINAQVEANRLAAQRMGITIPGGAGGASVYGGGRNAIAGSGARGEIRV